MKTTRILAFLLLCVCLVLSAPGLPAAALEEPEIDAGASAILCHNESGTVIFRQNAEKRVYAGAVVRLAAALVFEEHYKNNVDKIVTVNKNVSLRVKGSTLNPALKTGEEVRVYDLLCAMLVANSDDALFALAYDLYPEQDNPPARMLEEIRKKVGTLGMGRTAIVDLAAVEREDLNAGNYTCAEDLLKLALEVQRSTLLSEICGKDTHKIEDTNLTKNREKMASRNDMISIWRRKDYKFAPATGLAADNGPVYGYNAVITAQYQNKHFTCVVVGCKAEKFGAFPAAKALIEWGEKNFSYQKVLDETEILGEIKVVLSGDSDYITVAPRESVSAYLPNDLDKDAEITVRSDLSFSELTAPVYEGLIAGKATVLYNGKELAKVDLVTTGSLSQSNNRYYMALAGNFFKSKEFIFICAGVLLLLIVYVLISARIRYLRQTRPAALAYEEDDGKAPPLLSAPESEQTGASVKETPGDGQETPAPSGGALPAGRPSGAKKNGKSGGKGKKSLFGVFRRKKKDKSSPQNRAPDKEGEKTPAKEPTDKDGEKTPAIEPTDKPVGGKTTFGSPSKKPEGPAAPAKPEKTEKTDKTDGTAGTDGTDGTDGTKKPAGPAKPESPAKADETAPAAAADARRHEMSRGEPQETPSAAEGSAEARKPGVQDAMFPEENDDGLLVFGGVSKEDGAARGEPDKPRSDYVPEGWEKHIRRD